MAYYSHELAAYTTALVSNCFTWDRLKGSLEDFVKRTGTVGANIDIVHHTDVPFGVVKKQGKALFTLP